MQYINITYSNIQDYGLINAAVISLIKGANNEWAFGITYMARILNVSRSTIYNAIKSLINRKLVYRNKQGHYCLAKKKAKPSQLMNLFAKVYRQI